MVFEFITHDKSMNQNQREKRLTVTLSTLPDESPNKTYEVVDSKVPSLPETSARRELGAGETVKKKTKPKSFRIVQPVSIPQNSPKHRNERKILKQPTRP